MRGADFASQVRDLRKPFYFSHHLYIYHVLIESLEIIVHVIQFLVLNNAIDVDCFSSSITFAESSYKHT